MFRINGKETKGDWYEEACKELTEGSMRRLVEIHGKLNNPDLDDADRQRLLNLQDLFIDLIPWIGEGISRIDKNDEDIIRSIKGSLARNESG